MNKFFKDILYSYFLRTQKFSASQEIDTGFSSLFIYHHFFLYSNINFLQENKFIFTAFKMHTQNRPTKFADIFADKVRNFKIFLVYFMLNN